MSNVFRCMTISLVMWSLGMLLFVVCGIAAIITGNVGLLLIPETFLAVAVLFIAMGAAMFVMDKIHTRKPQESSGGISEFYDKFKDDWYDTGGIK